MGEPAHIRLLRADEIEEFYKITNEAFRRYLALIGRTPDGTNNPYAYLPNAVADQRAWCAVLNGRMIGVAQVDTRADDRWAIDIVGVLEDFTGHGIGRSLMARIETEAVARNVNALELNTLEKAPWLWEFYQRLGFHITKRAPPSHGLDTNTRVFMTKHLTARDPS